MRFLSGTFGRASGSQSFSPRSRGALIVAAALAVNCMLAAMPVSAADSSPTPGANQSAQSSDAAQQKQLLEEVRALRAEVDQLKAAQKPAAAESTAVPATATTTASSTGALFSPADQEQATKSAVETDAASREPFSFAALAAVTGFDNKGFVLADESGNNVFRPGYILQVRNVANWRQGGKFTLRSSPNDFEDGWEIRRAKFFFTGNIFTPDLTYRFQFANQVNGPSFALDDAWLAYHFYTGDLGKFSFKVGQFKIPVNHEEYEVGDEKQLAAERSLVNDILGGGAIGPRSQGIELLWNSPKDVFHAEAMLHDGSGNVVGGGATNLPGNTPVNAATTAASSLNTNFMDGKAPYSPIFGTAGRFEWKAAGDWGDYIDFTARATKKDLLVFGGSADYTQAVNANYIHAEVDGQYKSTSGFTLYGALLGDFTDFRNVAHFNNNFDYGALVQLAYAFNHKIEPFVRADAVKLDDDFSAAHDMISEFTLGVNYYFGDEGKYGHHAKFTLDGSYLPVGSGPVNRLNEDELTNTFHNEFIIQTQFQLYL